MTSFNEREQAFEKRFAVSEEKTFKARAKRNSAFAAWVATQMSLEEEDAEAYIKTIETDCLQSEVEELVVKAKADLAAKGIEISEVELFRKAEALLTQAYEAVAAGA